VNGADETHTLHKVYFAGDTGYRTVTQQGLSRDEEAKLPHCPAFVEIGDRLGPFDLALLPIGLCQPRHFMSGVHCDPYDSICVHRDIKSKKSIGMHWGTVRGGISQDYEDVRDPPKWWREAAEKAGLKWGDEVGLLDIGETLVLS
jgi:L-ascorbate metabolism protein UlaG (beta-lactamase superfamily)